MPSTELDTCLDIMREWLETRGTSKAHEAWPVVAQAVWQLTTEVPVILQAIPPLLDTLAVAHSRTQEATHLLYGVLWPG